MLKKIIFFLLPLIFLSCAKTTDNSNNQDRDYKEDMRLFIRNISSYAKSYKPNFYIIPQNGHNLVTVNGEQNGYLAVNYLNAIDGLGREDLYFGYENDNQPTPTSETENMLYFLNLAKENGKKILVTDYCSSHTYMDSSYQANFSNGFISFAANHRGLDNIPDYPQPIFNENDAVVDSLIIAKNFLYLLDTHNFSTKEDFINAITQTNYDLLIMDLFFRDDILYTQDELNRLKSKANGGKRLLIAYMSIGEAENYRYYWNPDWLNNPPDWLLDENPNWEGNYKVKYWMHDWQNIIFGNDQSYLKKILDSGFDGVYLDLVDAFEYFE